MSFGGSYIFSAREILRTYDGNLPFNAWIKAYFKLHKKFGSRDRKHILRLCYGYFRLGNAFSNLEPEEKIITGLFLTSSGPDTLLKELKPEWNDQAGLPLSEKLILAGGGEELTRIFPFTEYLSKEIDPTSFSLSHLVQPLMFLRMRPGMKERICAKLDDKGIAYTLQGKHTLSMPAGIKVEEYIDVNREAVVQDLSSQQTISLNDFIAADSKIIAWDCCAASGGKSILLKDLFPHSYIWVSDIRESIIANLKKRFSEAGIKNYHSFVADITSEHFSLSQQFDLVICDAPCSGSGTWGRTPEQLLFFKEEKIEYYNGLQKKIALRSGKQVKPGGYFLYITCSVFQAENEEVVAFLQKETKLELKKMQYIKGYDKNADTLFTAVFQSPW